MFSYCVIYKNESYIIIYCRTHRFRMEARHGALLWCFTVAFTVWFINFATTTTQITIISV